jgi:hypothetical protein
LNRFTSAGRVHARRFDVKKTAKKASKKTAKKASKKTAKKASKKTAKKASSMKKSAAPKNGGANVVYLSGGNPQIAKGDGEAPVQAYISAMPEWKRDIGERLDAIITKAVPGVKKAVKWNSPFYGVEGQGFFVSFHVFAKYVKVTFFRGSSLQPQPPGASKVEGTRYYDIYEGKLDEAQFATWVKQAAAIPGWTP